MQALMLAAGMGRRMGKYTEAMTKCMVEVGGRTLLERTAEALRKAGIKKFVMVVGWECEKLIAYIEKHITGLEFQFIYNRDYASTNNIYSLYLAREQLAQDDTILLESDLVYDSTLLSDIVKCQDQNLVAVAKYEEWMDGTVTTIDEKGYIREFIEKKNFRFEDVSNYYKTVNIYKLSKEFSQKQYIPFLEAYIAAYGTNQYYELVLKAIAHVSNAQLKAFQLQNTKWYEIDNAQDLDIANTLFAPENTKLEAYEYHFGGYWKFPGLKDFCYLVNPFFPPKQMVDQMKFFYNELLTQYPSGMLSQKLLAGKMLSVAEDYLLVGNGAAELINVLGRILKGKLCVSLPAFNEYVRCFQNCEIVPLMSAAFDFRLDSQRLCDAARETDILAIVTPDNPSGCLLPFFDLVKVLDVCKENNTLCIVDESFIDFAEKEKRYTLLDNRLLAQYPNLIAIKSISKSYGVPGLRLGVLASSDIELLHRLRKELPIWNINSYAEYFMQIIGLYQPLYREACEKIVVERRIQLERLQTIRFLRVYPSQANYIMCEVSGGRTAREIASQMLNQHNILIKDLSQKQGFDKRQFIRIAVKDSNENLLLYKAMKSLEEFDLRI